MAAGLVSGKAQAQQGSIASAPRFIDALLGDDSNSGTEASPWRSLHRATNGDVQDATVLRLRCGRVWREQLTLPLKQGTQGVEVSAYGDECTKAAPTISGADLFNGQWQRDGKFWSRPLPANQPKISQLRINGTLLRTAQWPNHQPDWNDFVLLSTAHQPNGSMLLLRPADAAFLADKDVASAILMVKSTPWFQDTMQVDRLDAASGTLQLKGKTRYAVDAGAGFFLSDKAWMLDAPGEFIHDTARSRLVMMLPTALEGTDPNQSTVEGSVRDTAVQVSRGVGFKLSGITIEMARRSGLRISESISPVVLEACIRDNGEDGLLMAGTSGGSIRQSSFVGNARTALDAMGASQLFIADNDAIDTGMGAQHAGWSAGAIVGGDASVITNNRIQRAAYHGIRYAGSGGSQVNGNTINGACARFSDCGAIYTWNGPISNAGQDRARSEVKRNKVAGLRAIADGAVGEGRDIAAGIYLDDFSRNHLLEDNTIVDVPIGVFVHNSGHLQILRNRMWNTSKAALLMIDWRQDGRFMDHNRVEGNDLSPAIAPQAAGDVAARRTGSLAISFHQIKQGMAAVGPDLNEFSSNTINLPANWRGPVGLVKSATAATWLDEDKLSTLDRSARIQRADNLHAMLASARQPVAAGLRQAQCNKR